MYGGVWEKRERSSEVAACLLYRVGKWERVNARGRERGESFYLGYEEEIAVETPLLVLLLRGGEGE